METNVDMRHGVVTGRRFGSFELLGELGRGATGIVYEARDTRSNAVVALKTLASMDAENLFRLKHEFRSLANLEHENFVRFGELACEAGQWFFTMEQIHGADFLTHVKGGVAADGGRVLDALAQLVEGLAALHAVGRIHRDVKPSNVLVTTEGRVVLLDFGLARGFGADDQLLGTPAYMAPEQIACDELSPATDWYAVGVILYEILAGRLPFGGDVPDILDAKLTQELPADWAEGTPESLRDLCVALLARDPRARPGIDEIRERLGLAVPSRAPVREVFIGRALEVQRLDDALAELRPGVARAVIVRGEPGIGKTVLVERFLSRTAAHTLVLRGRCYEQESVPFGGIDSLMDALSEYLVGLPASGVDRLLAGGVSNVARVFPVLRRVPAIGAQHQQGPILNPTALREQAFRELSKILAALGHARTLVVSIDDLQWLDPDGLALVRAVLLSSGVRCLLVATLRSDASLSPEIAGFVGGLETVDVPRLSGDESLALWTALGAGDDGAQREAFLREAAGHPLFLAELRRAAQAGSSLRQGVTRLEDALWNRVSGREPIERRFVEMAALAGAPTPCAVVARAAGLDVGECLTRLGGLRAAQLLRVLRVGDQRCVEPYHERIREAVVERLREQGAPAVEKLHLALGRALLEDAGATPLGARVFAVVQHLNAAKGRIGSEQERTRLAELNLLASQEAYRATAFERSREYAILGIECLPPSDEATALRVWRDLHVARFTAEYLTAGRDAARATFEAAKGRARTRGDRAALYVPWIVLETTHFPKDAVRAAGEIGRELGSRVPSPASKIDVLTEYARAHWARRGRPADAFATAPEIHDETTNHLLGILVAALPAAYFADANLFPWICLRIAHISMRHGLSAASPIGFVGYGMVLTGAFGKLAEGAAFGRVACTLARSGPSSPTATLTEFMAADFLASWVAPFTQCRRDLEGVGRVAAQSGDAQNETFAAMDRFEMGLVMGSSLEVATAELAHARGVAQRHGMASIVEYLDAVQRMTAALRGSTLAGVDLPVPALGLDPAIMRWHFMRAELGYLAGEQVSTLEKHLAQVDRYIHTAFANIKMADIHLLRALVAARGWEIASALGRPGRVVQVARAARALEPFAKSCPANFEPPALLARAELARVMGRARAATDAYERAIASAARHGSPKREALACELAAAHARRLGDGARAEGYARRSADAYRRWGATAKACMLEGAPPLPTP